MAAVQGVRRGTLTLGIMQASWLDGSRLVHLRNGQHRNRLSIGAELCADGQRLGYGLTGL